MAPMRLGGIGGLCLATVIGFQPAIPASATRFFSTAPVVRTPADRGSLGGLAISPEGSRVAYIAADDPGGIVPGRQNTTTSGSSRSTAARRHACESMTSQSGSTISRFRRTGGRSCSGPPTDSSAFRSQVGPRRSSAPRKASTARHGASTIASSSAWGRASCASPQRAEHPRRSLRRRTR